MDALAAERGGQFGSNALFTGTLARVLGLALEEIGEGRTVRPDSMTDACLGRIATDLHVARLLSARSADVSGRGESPMVESAMAKLFATEVLQRGASELLDLLGPAGLL